jgi:hypothetical protein
VPEVGDSETGAGGLADRIVKDPLVVTPLYAAVTVATVWVVDADAFAVKLAEFDPAATITVDGTWTTELLLESATVEPPIVAGPVKVMVPLDVPGPTTVAGLNVTELTTTGAGLTVSVTPTLCGESEAPAAKIVIVALYVPGLSPAGLAETVRVEGAVPKLWPSESHC